ncbi:MAG: 50S ribosomal protein L18 [Firmicutes bacterium]|nr:50S ribosomal protein L18 [Bacillota bacterium]
MIIKENKNLSRQKRHKRVRAGVFGTPERPRLSVYKSTTHIYAQLIVDTEGKTLASSSSIAKGVDVAGLSKTEAAKAVGISLAARAKEANVASVVFDRGGYLYTGRVKALADGAREGGLEF